MCFHCPEGSKHNIALSVCDTCPAVPVEPWLVTLTYLRTGYCENPKKSFIVLHLIKNWSKVNLTDAEENEENEENNEI
jgi:hypothetical protein